MNISLPKHLADLIKKKVRSGRYGSASEVVRDALRLLERHDETYAVKLERLRADLQRASDQLARGEGIPGPEAFRRARAGAERKTG